MTASDSTPKGLDPSSLYWSSEGECACATHAPYNGSTTWVRASWREMTAASRKDRFQHLADNGLMKSGEPLCDTCRTIARREPKAVMTNISGGVWIPVVPEPGEA